MNGVQIEILSPHPYCTYHIVLYFKAFIFGVFQISHASLFVRPFTSHLESIWYAPSVSNPHAQGLSASHLVTDTLIRRLFTLPKKTSQL